MTSWPKYARAPLISAVIEFRLVSEIVPQDFDRLKSKFLQLKWHAEEQIEFQLQLQPGETMPAAIQRVGGLRYTAPDADKVIAVDRRNYSMTVLPPYPGWQALLNAFWAHYATWRKIVGKQALGRIGVRYVNRFDIPVSNRKTIDLNDYLTFATTEPALLDEPVRGILMQVNSGIKADDLRVNLSTATVESPIIDHASVTLDIDLYREDVDVPQSDADINAYLDVIRHRRTEIFEQCITDEMRRVIS